VLALWGYFIKETGKPQAEAVADFQEIIIATLKGHKNARH
jgi:hypothetical protein